MASNRFRLRFTFWLDLLKADEAYLADQIEFLKTDRSFASTIRNGIRLILDLRQGKLDVLFELFPWVKAEFLKYTQIPTSQDADLQNQLYRLEQLLIKQGNTVIDMDRQPVSIKMLTNNGTSLTTGSEKLPSVFSKAVEPPDPREARKAFAGGMGNLFDADDDWDD